MLTLHNLPLRKDVRKIFEPDSIATTMLPLRRTLVLFVQYSAKQCKPFRLLSPATASVGKLLPQ